MCAARCGTTPLHRHPCRSAKRHTGAGAHTHPARSRWTAHRDDAARTIEPHPELIAHEFEHIIEQLDGVDLAIMSRLRSTGVKRVNEVDAFETRRAIVTGLRVARGIGDRRAVEDPEPMMTVPAPVILAAAVAAVCLTAGGPQALVTVAQRDANRSPRSPRSADISTDGRFVAFESQARLVAADVDDLHDIYVLDRTTGQVTLETSGSDDECNHPRISGDGRYVVYESRPSSAQASPRADIALRDRVEGTTRLLSQSAWSTGEPFGWSRSPDISDDGRVIAFSSAATTLGQGPDVNGAAEDIYLVQLPGLTITRASVLPSGAQLPRGDSILPSLSAAARTRWPRSILRPGYAPDHCVHQRSCIWEIHRSAATGPAIPWQSGT